MKRLKIKQAVIFLFASMLALACAAGSFARAQNAQQMLDTVIAHENEAAAHRGHYTYRSEERSDRTNGHLWVEHVAETNWGKVRYLVSEDGEPLSGDRLAAENARVADEAAHPDTFKLKEAARADDEQHAKQMLALLPKAFLFDPPQQQGADFRIAFRPNPDYRPQSMEERVLHGMSGTVSIDQKTIRLHEIEGKMAQDVSIGFGLLATIRAGSSFTSKRAHEEGLDWKTQALHTDIRGKALFLKTIARQQESTHSEFKRVADDITVADAVALLKR